MEGETPQREQVKGGLEGSEFGKEEVGSLHSHWFKE